MREQQTIAIDMEHCDHVLFLAYFINSLSTAAPPLMARNVTSTRCPKVSFPRHSPVRPFKASNDCCAADCAGPADVQSSNANNVTIDVAFIAVSPCLILFFFERVPPSQRGQIRRTSLGLLASCSKRRGIAPTTDPQP